jgi:hypothetical protein
MHHIPTARTAEELQLHLMVSLKYRDMMAENMEAGPAKTQYLLTADLLIGDTQRQLETLLLMKPAQPLPALPPVAKTTGALDHAEAERILIETFGPPKPAPSPSTSETTSSALVHLARAWRVVAQVAAGLLLVGGLAYLLSLVR